MGKRIVMTAAAAAVGAAVLIAALILGEPADPISDGDESSRSVPEHTPPGFRDNEAEFGPRGQPFEQIGTVRLRRVNDRGQRFEMSALSWDPLPDGRHHAIEPRAFIHLVNDQRVIEIIADEGRFVAPDNQPRSGTLEGDVRVVLYEAPPGRRVDLSATCRPTCDSSSTSSRRTSTSN